MPSRNLTSAEQEYVAEIFRDSVGLGEVRISRGSIFAVFSATTLGNTIYLQARDFTGETLKLGDAGRATLVHEMGHVWQYQHGGIGYVLRSLWAQLKAFVTKGNRDAAYDWLAAANANLPWEKWNPEQQAECIACYNRSWRRKATGKPDTKGNPGGRTDDDIVMLATPYMEEVWTKGAP